MVRERSRLLLELTSAVESALARALLNKTRPRKCHISCLLVFCRCPYVCSFCSAESAKSRYVEDAASRLM